MRTRVTKILMPAFVMLTVGCGIIPKKTVWYDNSIPRVSSASQFSPTSHHGVQARTEFNTAVQLEQLGSPDCCIHYYRAAVLCWEAGLEHDCIPSRRTAFEQTYHQSVTRLLVTAQRFGFYQPGHGIVLRDGVQQITLAMNHRGFEWAPVDFQEIVPVRGYRSPVLSRRHCCNGLGVPVVVRRCEATGAHLADDYITARAAFAATVVLVPTTGHGAAATLEFVNPLVHKQVVVHGQTQQLANDLSAPFAYREATEPPRSMKNVLISDPNEQPAGVHFLEPYQFGKIPVVLIHGLLSSPQTWIDMANELRAIPGFTDRFQIWSFRYNSGQPFLESAAQLRHDLDRIRSTVKQATNDTAIDEVVLIGHSMGGLIAKCQVVEPGDQMWRSVADTPIGMLNADEQTKHRLASQFHFSSHPSVKRVIFIAVPHKGATRPIQFAGRVSSHFIPQQELAARTHANLMANNRGVFAHEVQRRFPNAIDLLSSKNSILRTLCRLPMNPWVRVHSIIGADRLSVLDGRTDGVVAVKSARYAVEESEFTVRASHLQIHRSLDTAREIARILKIHSSEYESRR